MNNMSKNYIFMPENHMDELYTSKNPLVKFMMIKRLNLIAKAIPSGKGLKILDAGCGEGHLIERLNYKNNKNLYYGIDITKIALKKAKKRCPYARLKMMDLKKINFHEEYFDIIICTEVIEHIPEYKIVIEELKRVLKKEGYLILTFPNETITTIFRFLVGRKPIKVPDHFNSFNPNKIKSLVKMKLVSQVNLPFNLPFFASQVCLMKFKK